MHLTNENFYEFAATNYNNRQSSGIEEFREDISRIKHLKKLVTRYQIHGDLRERLILNHIMIMCNVFGNKNTVDILFLKMYDQIEYLKPFMVLLQILPDVVSVNGTFFITEDIQMDLNISKTLSKI